MWSLLTEHIAPLLMKLRGWTGVQPVLARSYAPSTHTAQTAPFWAAEPSSYCPAQITFKFVNDNYSSLATSFFAVLVNRLPHSPLSMWGNHYFGTVPRLYKDTCVIIAPSEPCTQIQFINRCARKYFFFLDRRMLCLECVGLCERTKVVGKGHSACRRISSFSRRKKRGKLWYSWLCKSNYTAELIASIHSLVNIEI